MPKPDKYDEATSFIIRRVVELRQTPHIALDWEKIAQGEISELLRSAFPSAPSVAESAEDAFDAAMRIRGGLSCDVSPAGKTTYTHKLLTDKEAAAEIEAFARSRVKPWRSAIEALVAVQNGSPLPSYDAAWQEAMDAAAKLLSADDAKEAAK